MIRYDAILALECMIKQILHSNSSLKEVHVARPKLLGGSGGFHVTFQVTCCTQLPERIRARAQQADPCCGAPPPFD
jgi:hypothetical protein